MTSHADPHTTRRARRDGWTTARRQAFLDLLRDGLDVRRAAARVGMSRRSAYHLRTRDAEFADAWDDALRRAQEEKGPRLIAELVAQAPWARAAFPDAIPEGVAFFSLDTVTGVTDV